MKSVLKQALWAVAGVGMMAGNAAALPNLPGGYSWSTAEYFSLTDLTTANTQASIELEVAAYESNFGFYTVDDVNEPTTITNTLKVFDKSDEPGIYNGGMQTVTFRYDLDSSIWKAQVGDQAEVDFSNTFGFYFEVYTGGLTDPTIDYKWYSDRSFNSDGAGNPLETNINHVLIAFNAKDKIALVHLDDQKGAGADRDFNDMIVSVNDVTPVPEPATMMLLGVGVAGLAGMVRKRRDSSR